ncbi:PEP-CTERM sorting domain-containing protein [Roseateles sp. P5_E7]
MHRFGHLALAIVGALVCIPGQAATYTEGFEGDFPAWETSWFGTVSDARNFNCAGELGCSNRGNNPDGLWIFSTSGSRRSVTVRFESGFAASLVSFSIDVATAFPTSLTATDKDGALIFDKTVSSTSGWESDPGIYTTYHITSSNGIGSFTFSGPAAGNTSVDNLVALSAVPEPAVALLMLAGAGCWGLRSRR